MAWDVALRHRRSGTVRWAAVADILARVDPWAMTHCRIARAAHPKV